MMGSANDPRPHSRSSDSAGPAQRFPRLSGSWIPGIDMDGLAGQRRATFLRIRGRNQLFRISIRLCILEWKRCEATAKQYMCGKQSLRQYDRLRVSAGGWPVTMLEGYIGEITGAVMLTILINPCNYHTEPHRHRNRKVQPGCTRLNWTTRGGGGS